MVLAPATDAESVFALAGRVRKALFDLNVPHLASSVADRVTASLGVAERDANSWEEVLKKADEALYTAKETGRNRVCQDSTTPGEQSDPASQQEIASLRTGDCAGTQENRVSVLIVDDNATNRMVCRRSLERAGYDTRESVDGRAALEEVAREQPCLILMDVMMPVMDGLECTRQLRANPDTRDIPIIIISACGDAADVHSGLEAGADEYLTKPIRPAELALRVRSMVERRNDRQNLLHSYEVRGEQTRGLTPIRFT